MRKHPVPPAALQVLRDMSELCEQLPKLRSPALNKLGPPKPYPTYNEIRLDNHRLRAKVAELEATLDLLRRMRKPKR